MSSIRSLTLDQLLAVIEGEDDLLSDRAEITLFPPENACGYLTDEDSGDENDVTVSNLPRSQLLAAAELTYEDNNDFDSEDDVPLSELQPKRRKTEPPKKLTWAKRDLQSVNNQTMYYTVCNKLSPIEIFEQFFDDGFYEMVVSQTNNYAMLKNICLNVSVGEMKCFFGILLLSGYNEFPQRSMFWENTKDAGCELVSSSLSRDRFSAIFSNLHFCDNNKLDPRDKFSKVRPLFDYLNKKFLEFAPFEEKYCIDESMVPYYGRHSTKQFIRSKPIRWGYKVWVGASPSGYMLWLDPYQGADVKGSYKDMGLGSRVVLNFCDVLQNRALKTPYHLYFDNFFTSLNLLWELKLRDIKATGTIRSNRIKNCPLEDDKTLKKKPRGSFDYSLCEESDILICKWNDNNSVTIASNSDTVYPTKPVKRFSRIEKKIKTIEQPNAINCYNKSMGGVDRADQNISLYRVSIRGKKWYNPLISYLLDVTFNNSWQLDKQYGGSVSLLAFRRRIALSLLESNRQQRKRGPSRPSALENVDSRYDRIDHFVVEQENRTRCRVCHMKAPTRCEKCDVGLHVRCFKNYHTKE